MLRMERGFAKVARFVNMCGFKTFNNPESGEPFTEAELQPWVDAPEITLDQAMKQWS